jgi:thiamine-monophosphate kinase
VGESGLLRRILAANRGSGAAPAMPSLAAGTLESSSSRAAKPPAGAAAAPAPGSILLGPGDDAAIWQPPPGHAVVLTQDALVEGVDFRRAWTSPHRLGRRALAVSLSDLAAMGARPGFCLVTLCAPGSTPLADVEALHGGLAEMAAESACPIVGGDVSAIDGPIVLDVVAGGAVDPALALRRDAGRPGDALVVTGALGCAAAGLGILRDGVPAELDTDVRARWLSAQLDPRPRIAEGLALAAAGVRCAGDVSDGLLVDARRTADASGCAAELWRDALPVDDALRRAHGGDWPTLALGGGEDFELLAGVPRDLLESLLAGWPDTLAPLTVVGRLVAGDGLRLLDGEAGAELALPAVASRHFGS